MWLSFLFSLPSSETFHGVEIIQDMPSELYSAVLTVLRGLGAESPLAQPPPEQHCHPHGVGHPTPSQISLISKDRGVCVTKGVPVFIQP